MRKLHAHQIKGLAGTDSSDRVAAKTLNVVHINWCAVSVLNKKVEPLAEKAVERLQEEGDVDCVRAVLNIDEQVRDLSDTENAEALIA